MFLTSTFRLTFFDRSLRAQCSVKKSQSKCGSQGDLKILPYIIMTLQYAHPFHGAKAQSIFFLTVFGRIIAYGQKRLFVNTKLRSK